MLDNSGERHLHHCSCTAVSLARQRIGHSCPHLSLIASCNHITRWLQGRHIFIWFHLASPVCLFCSSVARDNTATSTAQMGLRSRRRHLHVDVYTLEVPELLYQGRSSQYLSMESRAQTQLILHGMHVRCPLLSARCHLRFLSTRYPQQSGNELLSRYTCFHPLARRVGFD